MQNFISDGYTEKGYIRAVPGLYGELRFEFRPVLPQSRTVLLREIAKRPDQEQEPQVAHVIAKQVVSWDVTNNGQPVPITPANVLRLRPSLFQKLWGIVTNLEPSDLDPKSTPEEAAAQTVDLLEAALNNRLPLDFKQEAAVKN